MADELDGVNEKNDTPETEADTHLEDNLYDTMEGGEKKPAEEVSDDVIDGDNDKPKEGDEADKPDDKDDKSEKEPVEDDDILGVEEEEEEKSEDDKKSDEEESKSEDDKSKAPEDYKLQLPEDSLLGDDSLKSAQEYAEKNKLTEDQAKEHLKAVDDAVEAHQKYLDDTVEERSLDIIKEKRGEWLTESKAHFGEKMNETVAKGNRFIKAAASPEFIKILKASGMGNQVNFMQLCAKGAELAGLMDDVVDLGGDSIEADKDLEDQLYTTMK